MKYSLFAITSFCFLLGRVPKLAAQTPSICTATSVPTIVRTRGKYEQLGDITVNCTAGNGGPFTLLVFASPSNIPIANRTGSPFNSQDAAVLLNGTLTQAVGTPGPSALSFSNITAPSNAAFSFRITNIFTDVSVLARYYESTPAATVFAAGQDIDGNQACWITFLPAANAIYLANNNRDAFLDPLMPDAAAALSNAQCTINGARTGVSGNGNSLSLNAGIAFRVAFSGPKNIYAIAYDNNAASRGWQTLGSWTPVSSTAHSALSVAPAAGTGPANIFTALYSSPSGAGYLNRIQLLFGTAPDAVNS